jgi:hypothetical protein
LQLLRFSKPAFFLPFCAQSSANRESSFDRSCSSGEENKKKSGFEFPYASTPDSWRPPSAGSGYATPINLQTMERMQRSARLAASNAKYDKK